jgi:hypothetical protein
VKLAQWLTALCLAFTSDAALAGPPYLTDDPVPTVPGHWEVFAFGTAEGRHSNFDGDAGFDINYGAIAGLQLTATLPLSFSHSSFEGWSSGSDDVEFGAKYRFVSDLAHGISASLFPRVILPTAAHSQDETARFLLPLWAEKDFAGGTTVFGGGGYMINPGSGNRDFWQAGLAITQELNPKLSVGAEINRQGSETLDGAAQTRAGLGMTLQLSDHYALLASAGPTWADHETGYHVYAALGFSY